MDLQIPRGSDKFKCPLWKKSMDQVCHTCPWWQRIRGKHPQSNEEIDRWECAITWLPMLLLENAQRQIHTSASIDKVATEINKSSGQSHETTVMLTQLLNRAMDIPRDHRDHHILADHSGEDVKRIENAGAS